jgi:hypothetical protein
MNNFFSDVFNHYVMTGLLLLLAATPGLMVAALPIYAPIPVQLEVIDCNEHNTFTDHTMGEGYVAECYMV